MPIGNLNTSVCFLTSETWTCLCWRTNHINIIIQNYHPKQLTWQQTEISVWEKKITSFLLCQLWKAVGSLAPNSICLIYNLFILSCHTHVKCIFYRHGCNFWSVYIQHAEMWQVLYGRCARRMNQMTSAFQELFKQI